MFELLFKYPPAAFARGHLVLLGAWPAWLLAVLVVLACGLTLGLILRQRARAPQLGLAPMACIWLLQSAAIALLLVLLWRPAIAVTQLTPRQNIVAVVIDDSRSMGIREEGGTRAQQAVAALEAGVLPRMQQRFQTRLYRTSTQLTRIASLSELGAPLAPATHLGTALAQLLSDTGGLPLGAVVLLSDGADTEGGIDRNVIEALRARRIPVHTVGFGREALSSDIELTEVSLPSQALAGSRVSATVKLRQQGFGGRTVRLSVRDARRPLAVRQLTLANGEALQSESVQFDVGATAGPERLEFSLEPLEGETNRANNTLTRLMYVQPEPRRILYFEGEPRWEYKFIRRAADDDPLIHLASVLRTTENKIYRQGIDDPQQLAEGFPTRAEELFGYQGLIIGSVDAGYFKPAQQALIRDFVDRRGGGLLLLGGRESLADGIWSGSLVAEALPVVLPSGALTFHRDPASVSLTPAGESSVVCRLTDDPRANAALWRRLPPIMDYQDPGTPKPGALVLAQMHVGGRTLPLLVTERYGRGRTAVLATGGTWRWQMRLPLGDPSHDLFWRQLLRWLASDTPGRVAATASGTQLEDQGHVRLEADVRDADYRPALDAQVSARIVGPGAGRTLALEPVPDVPGHYAAEWSAEDPGVYVAEIGARRGAGDLGRDVVALQRVDGVAENFHTEQNRALLAGLAQSTGGRFWQLRELSGLPDAIPYSEAGVAVEELKELWNMPALLIALLLLRGGEWLARRHWGVL